MRKTMKKTLATTMAMAMVLAMPCVASAADPSSDAATTPIFTNEVESVIVPTSLTVALNPQELTVKVGDTTSTAQVLSKTVGIVNKSSRAKDVKVKLAVADASGKVTFKDSSSAVTSDKLTDYFIYLEATPASAANSIKKNGAAIDASIAAADLAGLTQTNASTGVKLSKGDNEIAFKLGKATYKFKANGEVVFGTSTSNDVSDQYEIDTLGSDGYTSFVFTGALNKNAKWTDMGTNQIVITPTYTISDVTGSEEAVTGTAGQIKTTPAVVLPNFTASTTTKGVITYNKAAVTSITKIEMTNANGTFDVYHAYAGAYEAATSADNNGVTTVTIDSDALAYFNNTNNTATITYVPAGETEAKTATVTLKVAD